MTDIAVKDEDVVVEVQAQVMTRDDARGGWVQYKGGGISRVELRRVTLDGDQVGGDQEEANSEYVICGRLDNKIILECYVKKDLQYKVANPKFHHWFSSDERFGLTFERSDDATQFARGIKQAVTDLIDASSVHPETEDDVFEQLDLPIERKDSSSQSASTTSTTTSSPTPQSPIVESFHPNFYRVHYITPPKKPLHGSMSDKNSSSSKGNDSIETSSSGREDSWLHQDDPPSIGGKSEIGLIDGELKKDYSYVMFNKSTTTPASAHDYSYPTSVKDAKDVGSVRKADATITMPIGRMRVTAGHQPPLPMKKNKGKLNQHEQQGSSSLLSRECRHCGEIYSQDSNARGGCRDGPDPVHDCIEKVACTKCANCLIYHCMSDADGEFEHPCNCDFTNSYKNCKKWTALTVLSLFIPCLWCYIPLMACHKCGLLCGCCGARHSPS